MNAPLAKAARLLVLAAASLAAASGDTLPSSSSNAPVETRSDVVTPSSQLDSTLAGAAEESQADPTSVSKYVKLGRLYIQKGDYDSAIVTFSQAIKIDPSSYPAFFNRGRAYRRMGDDKDAIADYDEAIHLNSLGNAAYTNRGQIYERLTNYDLAIADESQSIAISSTHSTPFYVRGNCYTKKGNFEKAAADLLSAVQLSPNYNNALNNYAWLLATCPQDPIRDGKSALNYAFRACEQSRWMWAAPIDTLAAAYAETGDFDDAIKWENKFLEYRISDATAAGALDRLALYKSHQPYRGENESSSTDADGE